MLTPIKWLKEYVDIDVTPEELADKLVSCGFEIEGMVNLADKVQKVVTAKVVSYEKHPNADRLSICQLDIGKSELLQVVTNAKNIKVGDLVPVSLDGAKLANGLEIKSGEVRGVPSFGMLCGGEEIGVTEADYEGAGFDGVLVLHQGTPVGVDINTIMGNDDIVLDVAVTSNRTDANSIYGIAREVATVLKKPLKPLKLDYKENKEDISSFVKVEDDNPDLCPRYMAKVVKNIKLCPSPEVIRNRLRAVGLRPINNIVDITNYILFEIGQPMHAFDLKTIEGNKIVIRRANDGEKITCLDDKEYALDKDNLVIANTKESMAVAGIMGGKNYSVLPDTDTIVFESARFARDNVRRTSRSKNLRSDSSARFEKGVDYWSQETGLARALAIIDEYGYGDIVGGTIDCFANKPQQNVIEFSLNDLERILGIAIPEDVVLGILNSLTIDTKKKGDVYHASIPSYREDMVGVNDIAEEVIRFYGYDHITTTLIKDGDTVVGGRSERQEFTDKLKNVLISKNIYEIVTYSFVSPKIFDYLNIPEGDKLRNTIKLDNPLGEDFSIMRTTLAHSMLKTLSTNFMRGNKECRFFEYAKTYIPKALPLTELPIEKNVLSLGALGDDFYSFKSIIEDLMTVFRIDVKYARAEKPYMHPTRTAEVIDKENGYIIGYLGEVSDIVANNYNIDKRAYIAELDVEYILDKAKSFDTFMVLSKYQAVERDIALVCDIDTEAQMLLDTIYANAGELLRSAKVFDVYQGNQVEKGKKSVAIKLICQSKDKTLKDADVNEVIDNILGALEAIGAKLR